MSSEHAANLAEALRAAETGQRDELRALLARLVLREGPDASLDERWLAAEAAYVRGDYPATLVAFARFDREARSQVTPPWQRYLSAHRRAFASLQLGRIAQAEAATDQAEVVLRASPELGYRYSDLAAMRGYLHELRGDLESARASFELAYQAARTACDANRALTTASDLGRIFGQIGRPAEGLQWLDRAEQWRAHATNARTLTTLRLRRAMLLAAIGATRDALLIVEDLIDRARQDNDQELLIDALARRAELRRMLAHVDDAEQDLLEACRRAADVKLVRHELYARKDLASLYLERAGPGDEDRAIAEFAGAIRLAAALVPPQALILMQLADSVLTAPAVVGRKSLPSRFREELESALVAARRASTSTIYQQRERSRAFERAVGHLSALLVTLIDDQLMLTEHIVLPRAGRVIPTTGKTRLIRAAEVATLRSLLGGPMTIQALSERLGKSLQATSKSVMRLREAIRDDLVVARVGQERHYSLRLPKTQR